MALLDHGIVDNDIAAAGVLAAEFIGQVNAGGPAGFAIVIDEIVFNERVAHRDQAHAFQVIIMDDIAFDNGAGDAPVAAGSTIAVDLNPAAAIVVAFVVTDNGVIVGIAAVRDVDAMLGNGAKCLVADDLHVDGKPRQNPESPNGTDDIVLQDDPARIDDEDAAPSGVLDFESIDNDVISVADVDIVDPIKIFDRAQVQSGRGEPPPSGSITTCAIGLET